MCNLKILFLSVLHYVFSSLKQDHPRTCGAYSYTTVQTVWAEGSSPHMRGILNLANLLHHLTGIIPAHAGHTSFNVGGMNLYRDHPRTCGAYSPRWLFSRDGPGSSPHMRGILDCHALGRDADGIIPAHAGHTQPRKSPAPSHRDHPRTCGAYVIQCRRYESIPGSSPHMRGRLSALAFLTRWPGIIPAHAGHTSSALWHLSRVGDHPRTCGAYDDLRDD